MTTADIWLVQQCPQCSTVHVMNVRMLWSPTVCVYIWLSHAIFCPTALPLSQAYTHQMARMPKL
jgi:hypothetical protein